KESIAALPLVLLLWEAWQSAWRTPPGARLIAAAKKTLPSWAAIVVWAVVVIAVRSMRHAWLQAGGALPVAAAGIQPASLWLGLRPALLTYVDLDQPLSYLGEAASKVAIPVLAITLAVAAVFLTRWTPRAEEKGRASGAWKLGLLWAVIGALPVALVGHHFSAYYVCFSAVGAAFLARLLLARPPSPATARLWGVSRSVA